MKKLKVLYTIPTPMLRGGMEAVMMNFIRHFDHERVQVDVAETHVQGFGDGVYDAEIQSYGGQVYYTKSERFVNDYKKGLRKIIEDGHYDVVHCHFLDDRSYIVLKIAKECGVPVRIAHVHNTRHVPGRNLVNRILAMIVNRHCEKRIGNVATAFFACASQAAKDFFSASNIDQTKVRIIPNAVDAAQFAYSEADRQEIRQKLGIPASAFAIGLIARFRLEQKNQLFLLDIFEELQRERGEAYLVLLGQGPDEATIKAKILEKQLKNVILVDGNVEAKKYYSALDVFVMPSHYEGLPVTIVEATANSLPCVVSYAIPKEVGFAGNIRFLNLVDPLPQWVKAINEVQRGDYAQALKEHGYDIVQQAQTVQEFYFREASDAQ